MNRISNFSFVLAFVLVLIGLAIVYFSKKKTENMASQMAKVREAKQIKNLIKDQENEESKITVDPVQVS